MEFVMSIPSGPNFDPRMQHTLASLRIQKPTVKAALCDVSNDPRCRALVKSYADIIAYKRHGPDKGQSDAINEGWRALDGDIYGWLNVDDYLAPDALDIVGRIFTDNPDIDVVYGQSLIMEGRSFIGLHSEVKAVSDVLYRSNIISQPSCFVRREALFKAVLLDVDLHYTMDWDLWARLHEMGAKFHYVPKVLSAVSWEETTKTASFNKRRYKELLRIPRRHAGWYVAQRTALSFLLEHLSQYGFAKPLFRAVLGKVRKKNDVPDRRWRAVNDTGSVRPPDRDTICEIPLFHYHEADHINLTFAFRNESKREIEIGGKASVFIGETSAEIDVDLRPAETKTIRVKSEHGDMSDLLSITLR